LLGVIKKNEANKLKIEMIKTESELCILYKENE